MPADLPILDIGALVIDAAPRPSHVDRWFDARIHVAAHPFAGTVETIFTDEELMRFADQLEGCGPEGDVVLGGGRACEVHLATAWQNGVEGGLLAVECSVTPSGDDPFPFVRFLVFDVDPAFTSRAVASVRDLAGCRSLASAVARHRSCEHLSLHRARGSSRALGPGGTVPPS